MDLAPTQVYEDEFLPTQRITYGANEEEEEQVGVLTISSVIHPVQKGINTIGRHPDCNIVLNNETVSKYHAEIEAGVGPGSTFICDLASSNKTRLNNLYLRPQRAYELKDGDSVKFGQVSAVYTVCRLNESTIPETPAPKNPKNNKYIIPGTPDTSLVETASCSANASVIENSHLIEDGKEDIFRRPSLPPQRISAGSSKTFPASSCTDDKAGTNVPVARKISMGDSDMDISEMETQEFPDFHSRKELDIHEKETQRFPVNVVVQENSDNSVPAESSTDVEKANDRDVQYEESIHDLETQRQSPDVEESIHDLETQNFGFGSMPRRNVVPENTDEDIHDFETQKIDIAGIRQRAAEDSVDEEQNDQGSVHDFETQKFDLPRIIQTAANAALDLEEGNDEDDIHDFETQKIDMAQMKEEEAKSSADNERLNEDEDIFDDETQRINIQKPASSIMFDIESPKNSTEKEESKGAGDHSDLETKDTAEETAQTLDNVSVKSTNDEDNLAYTTESSVVDNNNIVRPPNATSSEAELLNISQEGSGVNGNSVNGSQDLLRGYVEEAYFSSDEMSVKQSTPERPSVSNMDGKINLEESPEISDNEESIFDAPTQCIMYNTKADSDSETDREDVFLQNRKDKPGNSKEVVEEAAKVPNIPTSFSDDSETDEEGHFIEMASREEETSVGDKQTVQNMSDREDSAESIDIFEAVTQKIEIDTKRKTIEPSDAQSTGFDIEFPDQDIFCAATQNVNNAENDTGNSRSEEILPEKSDADTTDDKDDFNHENLPDANVLKTSDHTEKIPTDVDDTAPTQLMELPEPQSKAKDNDLSRATTSGVATNDYDLLPTQIMDEDQNDGHENIQKDSSSENPSELNHEDIHAEKAPPKIDDVKMSVDVSDENNCRPNADISVVKTLNVTKQKDEVLKSSSSKDTNVTVLEVVHMDIDETLPSQLVHLQKHEEGENTSSDRLSTSIERNADNIMSSTALDDHSIRDIIGVPQDEVTAMSPRDASVEDLEYELAPTQLISEVEKATAEEKSASRNVSIVKPNRWKTKNRGPCRVNLNDTIERNLNDMFDGANDGQIQEPQQMSTQHLEKILQASQDDSIASEVLATDDVLQKSPSMGVKRKRPKVARGKNKDNDANSQEKNLSNSKLKNKPVAIRSTTDSQGSATSSQEISMYFFHLTTKRKRNVIRDSQDSENFCMNGTSVPDDKKDLKNVDKEVENISDKDSSKSEIDKVDKYLISDGKSPSEMGRKTNSPKTTKIVANPSKKSGKRNAGKSSDVDSSQTKAEKERKVITSSDDSQNSTISTRSTRNLRKAKSSGVNLKENVPSENTESLPATESYVREQDVNKHSDVRSSENTSESNTVTISNVSDDSQSSGTSKVRPKRNTRKTRASQENEESTPVISKDLPKTSTVQRSEDVKENKRTNSFVGIVTKSELQEKPAGWSDDEDILAGLPAVNIYGTARIPGSPSASSTSTVHEMRPSGNEKKGKARGRNTRQNKSRRGSLGIDEEPFRLVRKMDSPSFAQRPKNLENFTGGFSPQILGANQVVDSDNADDSDEDLKNMKELANKILSVKGKYASKNLSRKNKAEETTKKNNKESTKKNDEVLSKNNTADSMKNRSDFSMSLRNTRSTRQSSKKADESTRVFQVPEEPPPPSSISETLPVEDIANNRKRPSTVLCLDESSTNTRSKRLKKSVNEAKTIPANKSRASKRKKSITNTGRESPSILNYLTQNNSTKSTLDSSSMDENTSQSNTTERSFESDSQSSQSSVQRGKRKAPSTADNSVAEVGGKKKKNTSSNLETSNESFSSTLGSRSENNSPNLSSLTPTRSRGRSSTSMTRSLCFVKHRILFTGVSDNEYAKILKNLGAVKVEDPMKCTVLVTDKVRRTLKFLCCLAQGTPIVSVAWLNESQAVGYFLDWEGFLLKDPAMEAKFAFKLAKSLNRAKEQRLLEGYTIVLTPNIAPPPIPELKSMILTCGGKVLMRAPAKWPEKAVIVSSEEDIANARKYLSKAPSTVTIQSKEFILTGILQQELNFIKNRLE